MKIGFKENFIRRIKGIFNENYRLVDTTNQIYNGKHYDYRSQQFFTQVRILQEKRGITQTKACEIVSAIYKVKVVVRKERDVRTQKDIEKVQKIIDDYYDDDFDEGIEVVNQFGTP